MQGRARITGEEVLYDTTRRWSYRTLPRVDAHQIVVLNTDDRPRRAFVEAEPYLDFDDWGARWISDEGGNAGAVPGGAAGLEPAHPAHPLRGRRSAAAASRQFQVRAGPPPPLPPGDGRMAASTAALSNGIVTVALRGGGLGSIAFEGTELLGPGGLGLHLRKDTTDTWTFHTDRWEEPVEAALGARRLGGRGDRAAARPRPPRRPPPPLPPPPDRLASAAASRRCTSTSRSTSTSATRCCRCRSTSPSPPSRWTDGIADGHVDREPSPAEWPFLGWSRLRVGDVDLGLVTSDFYSHSLDGSDLAADPAAQPAHGLGRRRPAHLRRPRPAYRPGRPPVRLHPALRRDPDRGRHGARRLPRPRSRSSSSTATRAWTGRRGARFRRAACGDRRCCATSPRAA